MFFDINTFCVVSSHLETLCTLARRPIRLQRHPTIRPSTKERAQIPIIICLQKQIQEPPFLPFLVYKLLKRANQLSCRQADAQLVQEAVEVLQGGWGATPLTASAAFFMDQLLNLLLQLHTLSLKLQFSTEEYD